MRILSFFLLIQFSFFSSAQTPQCGTMYADSVLRSKIENAPSLVDFENWLQQKMNEPSSAAVQRGSVITIPVIVHVIHDGDAVGSGQNISQAQVLSQFDALNEDFRRLNADAANTPSGFLPVAADIEIEFCPAVVDPNGLLLSEPGIDRVNMGQATWASSSDIDINLKPATIWDPNRYYNIWTVDFGGGSNLLGYAQFPEGSGLAGMPTGAQTANTDGVVCRYTAFGREGNVNAPYNQGRTATHETGHWLGLRHIWGDGDCSVDDYCTDTPESDAANSGCDVNHVSCVNVNMVQNYMDYSNDACMNLFTLCQKTRMRAVMQNSPRRVELLNSTVCELLMQYDVAGQVRDAQTLQGVAFAKVRFKNAAYNYEATCDASGNFTVSDMFEGTYNVYGGKWSYITSELNVAVGAGMSSVIINVNAGYYDDFVLDYNWQVSGTAPTGIWERAQPVGTTFNGVASNPGADIATDFGTECFTTGNGGGAAGNDDVDNGTMTLTSPVFDLTGYTEPYLSFYRWFYNGGGTGTPNDQLLVKITNGTTTAVLETLVYNTPNSNQWNFRNVRIEDYVTLSANMQFILETSDLSSSGHIVEAALDFFRIVDSLGSEPQAAFSADVQQGCVPVVVHFTDASLNNPASWLWNFPGGTPATSSLQNPVVAYAAPGVYDVTLIAGNTGGFDTLTGSAFIQANANPVVSLSQTGVSCFGGSDGAVAANVAQGLAPYQYQWQSGQTSSSLQGISAGSYSVTVTDAVGCKDTASASITQPADISISITATPDYCNNANGTAAVSVSGGTPGYSLSWSNGASGVSQAGLSAGNYFVTVADANFCVKQENVSVNADNSAPVISLSVSDVNCFGGNDGSIVSTITDGTQPYVYSWSTGSSSQNIAGLLSGIYTISVSDAHGCTAASSASVNEPAQISITGTVTPASCNLSNGAIQTTVSGGVNPYSYSWSEGSTAADLSSVFSGNYSLTVADSAGCEETASFAVNEVGGISFHFNTQDVFCYGGNDGEAMVDVVAGTPAFHYLWSTGDTLQALVAAAGIYSVTVTDANGCTASGDTTISEPAQLNLTIAADDIDCHSKIAAATAEAAGGVAPYDFAWSNLSTADTANLAEGTHHLTVTDANGCVVTDSVEIAGYPEPAFTLQSTPDTAALGKGTAAAIILLGTPPFSFAWNDPQSQTAPIATGLTAGIYSVTVTDGNGCSVSDSVTVGVVSGITLPEYAVSVYPNPGSGIFVVQIENKQLTQLAVFNALGKQILELDAHPDAPALLDLTAFGKGIYFLKCSKGVQTLPLKLMYCY